MRLLPNENFGRYRIIEEIGRGGMGAVFRSRDTLLERDVALKVLGGTDADGHARKPEAEGAARLLREARAAAAINHPNAVSLFDVGEVEGIPYLAMELIDGRTLRSYVGQDQPKSDVRVRWITDIARALVAAHERRLVHRDVKPENVIVRDDGIVKVLDFGIARAVAGVTDAGGIAALTAPGRIIGTPAYMPPEQVRGETLDGRADQFAWGVVAYELFAGDLPWGKHGEALRVIAEMATKTPRPLREMAPDLASEVAAVITRALSCDRDDRFASMSDVVAALEPFALGRASRTDRAAAAGANALGQLGTAKTEASTLADSDPSPALAAAPSAESGEKPSPVLTPEGERLPAQIGKYRPVRWIARGGMGAVYEVEHVHTGERWALKVLNRAIALDPAMIERFKREARVSARVKSEHIVRVIDADVAAELDGAPYMVMELLDGQDLGAISVEPQPSARVIGWFRQVARGLEKAHAIGIVHRDLKPENLFLARRDDGSPVLKILDFGVAKVAGLDDASKTASGAPIGTPLYMAPEQAAGDSQAMSPAIDVWAMGILAYRLLTAKDYWTAPSVSHLLAQIVYTEPDAPSKRGATLGNEFDAWFLRSCAKKASDRFASVSEQVEALATLLRVPLVVTPSPESNEAALGLTQPVSSGTASVARDAAAVPAAAHASLGGSSADRAAPRRGRAGTLVGAGIVAALAAVAVAAMGLRGVRSPTNETASTAPAIDSAPPRATTSAPPSTLPSASSAIPSEPAPNTRRVEASQTETPPRPPAPPPTVRVNASAAASAAPRASGAAAASDAGIMTPASPRSSRDPLAEPH